MENANSKDIVAKANKVKELCRTVFSSAHGQELLKELKTIYCDGKLYCDNDRDTIYFVAQRDLILELEYNTKATINGEQPNGEDVS